MLGVEEGAVGANDNQRGDWYYCYVMSGAIDYFYRPTGSDEEPTEIRIKTGQMFFTPPMVDHAMKFPVDTVFLTLGGNPRDQESYEADVVRISLIEA